MTEAALRLSPMSLGSALPALRIARECFGGEAGVIALTWGWHALRRFVPLDWAMARSTGYEIREEGRWLGSVWRVTSLIHGRHMVWLSIDAAPGADWVRLLPRLLRRLVGNRLAVIRLSEPSVALELLGARLHGSLPAPDGRRWWIYSMRASPHLIRDDPDVHLFPASANPSLDLRAQFHLAYRSGDPVGLTGLYTTGFWPGVGWGGWGALRRSAAQRGTAHALIAATERLAWGVGARAFLIETSDAPAYRAARRMYELHGLEPMLRIDDFFGPGEAYLIYGRPIGGSA